jgi:hypothetical protein
MTKTFIPQKEEIQALHITQIIFDDSDLVSLKAECRISGLIRSLDLLLSFKQFNDMLRFTGQAGEEIQLEISDKLNSNDKNLYVIDLSSKSVVFTTVRLNISLLTEEDNNTYVVDDLQPLSFLQQAKNLKKNIRDFDMGLLENNRLLKSELLRIAKMYRYYKGLLTLNINDTEARKHAGLENDKLFQLAFMASH